MKQSDSSGRTALKKVSSRASWLSRSCTQSVSTSLPNRLWMTGSRSGGPTKLHAFRQPYFHPSSHLLQPSRGASTGMAHRRLCTRAGQNVSVQKCPYVSG